MSSRIDELDAIVRQFDLNAHPFYVAWRAGELPIERLREYATEWAPLIAVMDRENLRHATMMAEQRARAAIRLLRSFDPTAPEGAIVPNPYAGGPDGFEEVLDICERACAGLLAHVRASP